MEKKADHPEKNEEKPPEPDHEKTAGKDDTVATDGHDSPEKEEELNNPNPYRLFGLPGKRFRHYLFDFLMLFLAVFCGFIAENWRVKLSEHQRESEYIRSIIDDVRSDTAQSEYILAQLKSTSAGIDSVLTLLTSPQTIENSNEVYRLWTESLGLEVFVSNDRTIQQLKNSGDLRLIRNHAVSDKIMEYDQTLKKYSVQSNLMYSALRDMTNYSQLFDFISLADNPDAPVPMTDEGKRSLNQAYANLQLWNRGLIGLIGWLEVVNSEGEELIEFIQKEYDISGR